MEDFTVEYLSIIKLRYRTLWIACLMFVVLLFIINISSYFICISTGWIFLFFIPTAFFYGLGIIDYKSKNKTLGNKRPLKPLIRVHIKPLTVILLIAIAVYYFIVFFNLFSFEGVPRAIDGKYVLNNHGSYAYINYELYAKACMAEARAMSAGYMLFLYIGFVYFFSRKTRLDANKAMSNA